MASRESEAIGAFFRGLTGNYILSTALLAFAVILTLRWTKRSDFPTINSYPYDFTRSKARAEFSSNARGLINEGIQKYKAPFRIITTMGSRVILPASYTDWLKNCLDLDHQALVHHEYLAAYSGMEGIDIVTDPRKILIDVTKTKLNQNFRM